MLLLFALIVGSTSAWAQSDYSATCTNNVTLTAGSNSSACTVDDYDGVKCGTAKKAGSVSFTVPSGSKYLHIHVAAWSGLSDATISISPNGNGVPASISLTSDTGISGNSPFTLTGSSTDFYKVITFTNALTSDTEYTITSDTRFVIWGVNSEAESSDPSSEASFGNTSPSINYPATKTYSQVATTATGYTGMVTYEITANTAGATIEGSTVTVTKGGSVTVKATAPAITGFKKSEATYTLTVNDTRTTPGLAWSASTASVTYGTTPYSFPTLTNDHGVSVNYGSTDEDVATIDNNGVITVKNVSGSTTISAEFEGNDDYLPQTVSYTLEVEKGPYEIIDGVFDFVEAGSSNPVVDYGSGVAIESNGQSYVEDEKTWTAGNVTMVTSGKYRWWYNGHDLRFYNTTPVSAATFSVPDGYVITKIVTTGGNFVTASVGALDGNTWTGASQSVKLSISTSTVSIKTITVTYISTTKTVDSHGWATYITPAAVSFEAGDAYVVTEVNTTTGAVKVASVESAPANTPVLLKGEGTKTMTVLADAPAAPETNMLSVSDGTANGSKVPYVLAKNGEGAGFKQWTGDISVLNGRVVMWLDSAIAARSFFALDGEEATGINEIQEMKTVGNEKFYNLAGQRIAQPTKGLYIVNGKKVIMK